MTEARLDRVASIIGPLLLISLLVWLATLDGLDGSGGGVTGLLWVLLTSAPWALAWLAAAAGFGRPLRWWLGAEGPDAWLIQAGAGVAALLVIDEVLGAVGILSLGGSLGGWLVLAGGIAVLIEQVWKHRPLAMGPPPWLVWTAFPAVAVLVAAACSAPGWLWASEFGGYDALSYHLQLPNEWLALGRIEAVNHNVYSYLPGYVEAAYYHLAVQMGDTVAAVYACQLLHGGLALLTAAAVARLVHRLAGASAAALAAVIVLGTPWVVVVGSLAYNEMAVALLLATGLLVLRLDTGRAWARGVVVGLLAAAACGAKLTSAGFVAAPLGLILLLTAAPGGRMRQVLGAAAAAAVALSPYLIRNWVYAGNPFFPFATGQLGLCHWTAEQAATWSSAHLPDLGPSQRLGAMWNQLFRYGLGPAPNAGEPWQAQWSVLPWAALAGLAVGAWSPRVRHGLGWPALVLVIQVLFWLGFTHLKSRFMLPAVVPAAMLVGAGAGAVDEWVVGRGARRAAGLAAAAAAIAWCCVPVVIFARERDGRPAAMIGATGVLTGDRLTPAQRQELGQILPAVYLNQGMTARSRILLVGEARPLYYRADVTYQSTWDRGPLSEVMRQAPDDPGKWIAGLRDRGYTHVLVNTEMLRRWADDGWNDPLITPQRVLGALDEHAVVERDFGQGVVLYRLG